MASADEYDDLAPKLCGKKEGTFAYITVKDRWPKIVTNLVDQLSRKRAELEEKYGPQADEDIRSVLELFSRLRYEIMTDKPLEMKLDSFPDSRLYRDMYLDMQTSTEKNEPEMLTWFKGPWLFVECFLYRLIYQAFRLTETLKEYDYFEETKQKNFMDHLPQMEEAAAFIMKICAKDAPVHEFFGVNTILKMSLWGNRADMSLTGGADSTLGISSISAASKLSEYVLVDDVNELLIKVFAPLSSRRLEPDRRIDIVLDNAGVELTGDLMLAEFLIARGFANTVHLHGKAIPWFVSDVTENDFNWTISKLHLAGESCKNLGEQLKKRIKNGEIVYGNHLFWTSPYPYYLLKEKEPELYKDLKKSSLIIFKGDLNYRKLVGDRDWDFDTSFETACRGFAPCPFFALRTLKAETVAGLSPDTVNHMITKFDDDNSWMTSGEYAVCQLGGIRSHYV